jgi:GNAT superfamily N-acetyltransferase
MHGFQIWLNEAVDQGPIISLVEKLKLQYPGLILFVSQSDRDIHVHEIKSPVKNKGIGTQVMMAIQQYAQSVGLPITLKPQPEPRSKEKLLRFYKRLGFYHNHGRRKDYSISSMFGPTWVWRPNKNIPGEPGTSQN